jgi:hypothetical protein
MTRDANEQSPPKSACVGDAVLRTRQRTTSHSLRATESRVASQYSCSSSQHTLTCISDTLTRSCCCCLFLVSSQTDVMRIARALVRFHRVSDHLDQLVVSSLPISRCSKLQTTEASSMTHASTGSSVCCTMIFAISIGRIRAVYLMDISAKLSTP